MKNEEKTRCPVCKGLKCKIVFGDSYLKRKDKHYYFICHQYDDKKYCKDPCRNKCNICGGTGYVDWVDQFFVVPDYWHKINFEKMFNIINDVPVKTIFKKAYGDFLAEDLKERLQNLIKD